jgi:hypothetical protein
MHHIAIERLPISRGESCTPMHMVKTNPRSVARKNIDVKNFLVLPSIRPAPI